MAQVDYQLTAYQRSLGTSEELFNRLALVQTFHETVLSCPDPSLIVTGPLPNLLGLDTEGFYAKAGTDLLETALILDCMQPCAVVDRYIGLITDYSPVGELMQAWSNTLSSLSASDSSGLFAALHSEATSNLPFLWDKLRLFSCKVLSSLLRRCSPSDYPCLLTSHLNPFLSLLSHPQFPPQDLFLLSTEFTELAVNLQNQVSEQRSEDLDMQEMKLITHLVGAFPGLEPVNPGEEILIETLLVLSGDFYSLLSIWRNWYINLYNDVETLDINAFHPFGLLRLYHFSTSFSPYPDLHLPCVLSNRAKFQLALPLISLCLHIRPTISLFLLENTVKSVPLDDFRTLQTPFGYITEYRQWTLQFLKELMDVRRLGEEEKKGVERVWQEFLRRFVGEKRCVLVRKLAAEYYYDEEIQAMAELYGREVTVNSVFSKSAYFLDFLGTCLSKDPLEEFPLTIKAALSLLVHCPALNRVDLVTLRWTYLQPLVEELTLFLSDAPDSSLSSLQTVLHKGVLSVESHLHSPV